MLLMKGKDLTKVVIAISLVIVAVAGLYVYQKLHAGKVTVTANGNYEMPVAPDQAVIYLLIQTNASSAEQAKNANAVISDDVLTALIKIGVDRKDIGTENYNMYPEYNWSSGEQKIIGYIVSNNMKITTKDFNNVGKIVDASVDNGALVSYINFELSTQKNNEYKALALANASLDARNKAEAIAAGLNKQLGSLISVSSSDYYYTPYPIYRAEEAGVNVKTVATNIQPTNIDVSASVSVVYEVR